VVPRTANGRGLNEALEQAGISPVRVADDRVEIAGVPFAVNELKAVRESDARLLAHQHEGDGGAATIIVADRISTAAREELSRAGLAWFDRRGHLWVRTPGLFVNAEVSSGSVVPSRRVVSVFRGTGLDVALALLVHPGEPQGVHAVARQIDRSPGRVSEILSELRSQGLVGSDNRPFVPELFWAVAEEWKPRWHPMPLAPPPEPPERFRLGGTLGAVSLGAPLAAGPAGGWPRLYVADDTDLATVVGAYGAPSGWTGSEIAVCPSRYGFTLPSTTSRDGFLVANGLIIALDLAQDRARGREILEGWDPQETARVW
jgi:hypothetical protein